VSSIDWKKFRVHAVTSASVLEKPDFFERALEVAASGCAAIHLRAHGLAGRQFFETAVRLRELTRQAGAGLIVNDRIDVALAAEADGVHLGARSIPLKEAAVVCRERGLALGYSCHSLEEAAAAASAADYIYFGTIFKSASKPETVPCGVSLLAEACGRTPVPVYGIGGIAAGNVGEVAGAGAAGAAVISAAWEAQDAGRQMRILAAVFG